MIARIVASLAALVAMTAWGLWLLGQARSKAEYVEADARDNPFAQSCEWMPMSAPAVAHLGLAIEPTLAWTDRADAYIALRTGAAPKGAAIDLHVANAIRGMPITQTWSAPGPDSSALGRQWAWAAMTIAPYAASAIACGRPRSATAMQSDAIQKRLCASATSAHTHSAANSGSVYPTKL